MELVSYLHALLNKPCSQQYFQVPLSMQAKLILQQGSGNWALIARIKLDKLARTGCGKAHQNGCRYQGNTVLEESHWMKFHFIA